MNCPKCHANMAKVTFQSVEVDRCEGCGGIWFDILEREDLKAMKGADEAIDTGSVKKGQKMDAVRKVHCPHCHTGMISLHVPDQPHIVIEQCNVCNGVFMDAGEFRDFSHVTPVEFLRNLLS
jgi:Zn-finger nucleic acid-binding protein